MSSNSNQVNLDDLFQQGQQDGQFSQTTVQNLALPDVGLMVQNGLGVPAQDVQSQEVFAVVAVIDDSGSIDAAGNGQILCDGVNHLKRELLSSNAKDDIIIAVISMNHGVIYPFGPLVDLPDLKLWGNYKPDGGTPLYHATVAGSLMLLAKWKEFNDLGAEFRGELVVVSDGQDESNPYRMSPAQAKTGLDDMHRQGERFLAAFMGIANKRSGFDFKQVARDMGFKDRLILTPDNTGHEIREAFNVVSRASKAASQGAQSFSKVAAAGFGSVTP